MSGTDLRTTLASVRIVRDVVLVEGPEANSFLQGQLSQDVDGLTIGDSAPSLLLQPNGKVDALLRVSRLGEDEVLLDVDAGSGEQVLTRLRRFKLRTKADLNPAVWSGLAVRGPGAAHAAAGAARRLRAHWPGVDGVDLIGPAGAVSDVPEADRDAYEALRVECGVPAMGSEITEATIPAELGQWLIDAAVSFTKGCYTGQELVARIDSRGGKVPRPVRGLVLRDRVPEPGAIVRINGAEVGKVTSSATSVALGPVALALIGRGVDPGSGVEVDGGEAPILATVVELPLV